jgi:hypothetical protein
MKNVGSGLALFLVLRIVFSTVDNFFYIFDALVGCCHLFKFRNLRYRYPIELYFRYSTAQ